MAILKAIGIIRAAVAVFGINCVKKHAIRNSTATIACSDGVSPRIETTELAINSPAPDFCMAIANGNIPANKNTVTQSIPL